MSKVFVFAFDPGTARGGLADLRQVLETDNNEGIVVTDDDGYLLPAVVQDIARRSGFASCLQVLHLGAHGVPQRQEEWQRIRLRGQAGTPTEPLVVVDDGFSYLRVRAGLCVLGQAH